MVNFIILDLDNCLNSNNSGQFCLISWFYAKESKMKRPLDGTTSLLVSWYLFTNKNHVFLYPDLPNSILLDDRMKKMLMNNYVDLFFHSFNSRALH